MSGDAKWSFAIALALRITKLLALCLTAMSIESTRVLNCALDCLGLSHCCSTTQSNLVVQFIVATLHYRAMHAMHAAAGWCWLLHLLGHGGVAAAFGQLLLCLHLLCVCPKLVWYATCARPRGRESEPKPFSCGVNVAYMLQRAAPKEITMVFEVLSLTALPTKSIGN